MKGLLLAAVSLLVAGQQNAPGHKVLTRDQVKLQADMAQWQAQREVLKTKARHGLNAENAREKAGDCPNANSTLEQEDCLGKETQKTNANYAEFAGAVRAMLALPFPGTQADKDSAAERVAQFDKLEAESKKYRDDASQAAYNEFEGGTLAPVFAVQVQQRLLRLHMLELAFIYDNELSDR